MSESNVKLTFGKINLKNSSATLICLRVQPPFAKESGINTGKSGPAKRQFTNSTIHEKVGGGYTTADVIHPEGTVIMLQGNRTRNAMRVADACIFLRLRQSGPFLAIYAILPTGPEGVLGDRIPAFQGRADIVSANELRSMNIEVPRSWERNYLNQEEVDELFDVRIISPAQTPAPTLVRIATHKGVEVKAIGAEAPRRIRLRRG